MDEVFSAMVETPPPERHERLEALCAGDERLRADVMRLVARDELEDDFLQPPGVIRPDSFDGPALSPVELDGADVEPLQPKGRRIGGFTLGRRIAVGGMGAVYEAVQHHPRRPVALKLMRGVPSARRLRRFMTESEILAQLHHPNIAQVYGAGTDDSPEGGPVAYIAIELIANAASITEFANTHELDLRARLELFLKVCDAVQHVHQRGVIHRDLKPGNILVDQVGRPRVIDFGVARLTEADPAATRLTEPRQLIGTPPYMSPEQLRGEAAAIDTRSDVYALGVILYELLSDQLPFEVRCDDLPAAILAIDAGPPRLGSLDRRWRGDLEVIVAKALAGEQDRRYDSAGALAQDIRRHLENEPIHARAPSAGYQLRKFARRHRALFAAGLLIFVVAAAGAGATAWMAIEATREASLAQQAARKSDRIAWFLETVLSSADPRRADADVTIRDALVSAAAMAESELAQEPDVLADVHALAGSIFVRLGEPEAGERHLRQALELRQAIYGDSHCLVARTMSDLAWALPLERTDEAIELFRGANDIRRAQFGPDHVSVAIGQAELAATLCACGGAAEAVALLRESLPVMRRELGENDTNVGFGMATLADALGRTGDLAAAEHAYRDAIAIRRIGASELELANTLSSFAEFLEEQGREREARPLFAEAADIRLRRLGRKSSCVEE